MTTPHDMTCDSCGVATDALRGVTAPWGWSDLCRECLRVYYARRPRTMAALQAATVRVTPYALSRYMALIGARGGKQYTEAKRRQLEAARAKRWKHKKKEGGR